MHIHVGAMDFLITAGYIIVFAFLWRTIAALNHDTAVGQAMSYLF